MSLDLPVNVKFCSLPNNRLKIYKTYSSYDFNVEKDEDVEKDPKDLKRKITLLEGDCIQNILDKVVEQYTYLEVLELRLCDLKVNDFSVLLKLSKLKLVMMEHVRINKDELFNIARKLPSVTFMIHEWLIPIK